MRLQNKMAQHLLNGLKVAEDKLVEDQSAFDLIYEGKKDYPEYINIARNKITGIKQRLNNSNINQQQFLDQRDEIISLGRYIAQEGKKAYEAHVNSVIEEFKDDRADPDKHMDQVAGLVKMVLEDQVAIIANDSGLLPEVREKDLQAAQLQLGLAEYVFGKAGIP